MVDPAGTSNVAVAVTTPPDAAPHDNALRAYAGEPPVTSPTTVPEVPGSAVNSAPYAASVPYFVASEFFSAVVAIAILIVLNSWQQKNAPEPEADCTYWQLSHEHASAGSSGTK
jgi:hypothetical protein